MAMYKPQRKHRANHMNYYQKPTRSEVKGLINLYKGVGSVDLDTPIKRQGVQLQINFK